MKSLKQLIDDYGKACEQVGRIADRAESYQDDDFADTLWKKYARLKAKAEQIRKRIDNLVG